MALQPGHVLVQMRAPNFWVDAVAGEISSGMEIMKLGFEQQKLSFEQHDKTRRTFLIGAAAFFVAAGAFWAHGGRELAKAWISH